MIDSLLRLKLMYRYHHALIVIAIVFLIGFIFISFNIYTSHIKTYTFEEVIIIDSGAVAADIVSDLATTHNHQIDFYEVRVLQTLYKLELTAGRYEITKPITLLNLLRIFDSGSNQADQLSTTVPEGFSNQKIYQALDEIDEDLPRFDLEVFKDLTQDSEGYLFPDTYFLDSSTTADDLYQRMRSRFDEKIATLENEVSYEDLILASIVEREVPTSEDRALVADLLLRRIEIGMRLQVDASLDYYLDKASDELTVTDLETDNPYNTYTRYGLPPTPIANPGLESIRAAINPEPNTYLFYLSDNDGITRFAEDFDGHVANRRLYGI